MKWDVLAAIGTHEIDNLAGKPESREVQDRLRHVLDAWIVETDDQGRFPEPPEVIRRRGATLDPYLTIS